MDKDECEYKTAIDKIGKNNYIYVHVWLKKIHGKANKCEICHKTGRNYQWALRKGFEYEKKLENFIQLCVSCHRHYGYNKEVANRISKTLSSKTRPNRIIPINRITINGDVQEYESIKIAANQNNILMTSIVNCLKGRSKKAGGYSWRYK